MFHCCTAVDSAALPAVRALHESLRAQAGTEFTLTILAAEDSDVAALTAAALPQVQVLALDELLATAPSLRAAQADRTQEEFLLTCRPWLLAYRLKQLPAGVVLTFLAPEFFFFSSPQPILAALGEGAIGVSPFGYAEPLAARERFGRFDAGLVCLRHDAIGLACAQDWAQRCAAWCFNRLERDRCGAQKYLEAWPDRFPGTVVLSHPGINVAPWNLGARRLTAEATEVRVEDQPLVCGQFAGLVRLAEGLYDPGLAQFGVEPDDLLRERIYQPYLRQLQPGAPADIVPRRGEDRMVLLLLRQVQEANRARFAQAQALERHARETALLLADGQARETAAARLFTEVEADRAAQRADLLATKGKLLKAYDDLIRDAGTIKALKAEMGALRADKDAQIENLSNELRQRAPSAARTTDANARPVLEQFARDLHRLVVLQYHHRLLPEILWLGAMGVQVEVLGSPAELTAGRQGPVIFRPQSAWEWLGQIDSLFDERAYRQANPDVAAAISQGAVASGWDHYLRFGQRECRHPGAPGYCTGLAEFDAVAFDGTDAPALVPLLAGRLQPHHRLFISGFVPPSEWLPPDEGRAYFLGDTLVCARPPKDWLGPRQPANGLAVHLPAVEPEHLYPERPAQRAYWPKLTVVTVCQDQAPLLDETIRSVLDQNYPQIEYIVVDCGSTDGSLDLIRRHAARVIILESRERNRTRALNEALDRATGVFCTWLNPGDRLAPGSLYTVAQVSLLHQVDLIAGRCARVRDGEVRPWQIHRTCLPLDRIAPLALRDLLDLDGAWLKDCFFNQPEVFLRREALVRVGGRLRDDLAASRDYDLWVRLARQKVRAYALPEILALARRAGAAGEVSPADLAELRATNAAHRAEVVPTGR